MKTSFFAILAIALIFTVTVANADGWCGGPVCKNDIECIVGCNCYKKKGEKTGLCGTPPEPHRKCGATCIYDKQCGGDTTRDGNNCTSCVQTSNDENNCCQCLPLIPGHCGGFCGTMPDGTYIGCNTVSCPSCSVGSCSPDPEMRTKKSAKIVDKN